MVKRHLSEDMKSAGLKLLAQTDALDMKAQGAMWLYSGALEDWRYYLVTSLVDTVGRRKTYRLLLDVFDRVTLPSEMSIEDVHLGSPNDPFFHLVSSVVRADNSIVQFENCTFNDVKFDGVVYRSLQSPPTSAEAARIDKKFQMKVRRLVSSN